jgi:hypothetical protein
MPPKLLSYIPRQALDKIEEYLKTHNIGVNRYRKQVGDGKSKTLGIVCRRCLPPDISRMSWLHPYLFKLILEFADVYVKPYCSFTSIQINDNYVCAPHKDINNIGESYIVGFGNYLGGQLCIEDMDYDIRLRGLLFDGSQLKHWTKSWIHNRYTLVFHTLAPKVRWNLKVPLISDYEVISDNGIWKVRRKSDGLLLWGKNGLPHPLKNRTSI